MAKAKTLFYCTDCGNEVLKWQGRCPSCGAWNTIIERPAADIKKKASVSAPTGLGVRRPRPQGLVRLAQQLLPQRPPEGGDKAPVHEHVAPVVAVLFAVVEVPQGVQVLGEPIEQPRRVGLELVQVGVGPLAHVSQLVPGGGR